MVPMGQAQRIIGGANSAMAPGPRPPRGPKATKKIYAGFFGDLFLGRQIDHRRMTFLPGVLGTRAPYFLNLALVMNHDDSIKQGLLVCLFASAL